MLVPVPAIEEQKEIADILALIDSKASDARGKRSAYENIFRTLLHGLVSAKTRVNKLELATLGYFA